jgi:hypothetical protein
MQLACIAKLRVSKARLGGVRAEHADWHGTAPMSCPGKHWRRCLSRGNIGAMVFGEMVLCKGGNEGI